MKTKLATKILTGAFATTLVFGTASFANAKGPDRGSSEEAHQTQTVHDRSGDEQKDQTSVNQKVEEQTSATSEVTDQTDVQKGKSDKNKQIEQKGKSDHNKKDKQKDNDGKGKKETKKEIKVTSKIGKTVEKRLTSSESTINRISLAVDSYFDVNTDGTTDKDLTKKVANHKYNSYKGKLNAEINKLRAIEKQLAGYKKKYKSSTAEIDALLAKVQELKQSALEEIKRVKELAIEASTPQEDETTPPTDTTGDTTSGTGDTTTTTGDTTSGSTDTTTTTGDTTSGSTDTTTTTGDTTSGSTDTTTQPTDSPSL